ncbi:glycosyltransferase [Sporolactobacillus shoreicorticis]|uniref:Glycosyltransferase n=1 Tax=Sporolactobacillus shoreicorticis TaxID=1923877 RepID=A0ABW5S5A4_9BACL|nr:glycosyltransferase [Sporolactobacillus shoreicorticis]MCO7124182.1 glycosyltransferase [Sporolactobacillus shoreicorticis]
MNICIINERFNKRGGVGRVATEVANMLHTDGYQVSLIDFSGENVYTYEVNEKIKRPHAISKLSFKKKLIRKILNGKFYLDHKSLNINWIYKKQINDLLRYLENNVFDIIIVCQGLLTSFIPKIKNEIPKIKIVAWQHNEYEIYTQYYYKKFIHNYICGIKKADLVVCLTEKDCQKFKELNENSIFIYNPITIENNEGKTTDLKQKNIIFVGRLLMKQKGLNYLIEIGKKLPNGWRILVAGEGKDKKLFKKLIIENELQDKIILKGNLYNKDLIKFYLSGSIFISTSRWEGFGLVLTEAMLFGLPIVSFKNNGPFEILKRHENYYGILIERGNIDGFISEIINLIKNPDVLTEYQKKSLERVQDFKKERILENWNEKLKKTYFSDDCEERI